jgi:hypothetical protein
MLTRHCTVSSTVEAACAQMKSVYPEASFQLVEEVALFIGDLFAGKQIDYQAADLQYHNLEHTLLAIQCYIDLAAGRVKNGAQPAFNDRDFSLGCAAILMHDTGYLKNRGDRVGTGAKFTNTHVERSCTLVSRFLPAMGVTPEEIAVIRNAIACTGTTSQIAKIPFRSDVERITGCMVATADYLGQMADPDYPEKLPRLFAEFEESNDFNQVPADKRMFKSAKDLMSKTGGFWKFFALPKLERDYEGVYRVLGGPDEVNPYVKSVEVNLERIATMAVQPD